MAALAASSLQERGATDADYESLYRLHVETMRAYVEATYGWHDEQQRAMFQQRWRNRGAGRVYIDNGGIVATWLIERRVADVYLAFIEVAPSHQNRGIGTTVVGTFIERAMNENSPPR